MLPPSAWTGPRVMGGLAANALSGSGSFPSLCPLPHFPATKEFHGPEGLILPPDGEEGVTFIFIYVPVFFYFILNFPPPAV